MQASDYLNQIQALLPPGPAWSADANSLTMRQAAALAESFARGHDRAERVLIESDPRWAYESLPCWERDLGLPDKCSILSAMTLSGRRGSVVAKYVATGGQSPAYFIGIAKALGFANATITQYRPRRCGERLQRPLFGVDWAHVWKMNLPGQKITPRRSGSPLGESFAVWGKNTLVCTINQLKPAHTIVLFDDV